MTLILPLELIIAKDPKLNHFHNKTTIFVLTYYGNGSKALP